MTPENGIAYYFFEHPSPRSKRMLRTGWRMTIEDGKRYGDSYKPILDTVEYRTPGDTRLVPIPAYPPGESPRALLEASEARKLAKEQGEKN